jgi:hypothetical protein
MEFSAEVKVIPHFNQTRTRHVGWYVLAATARVHEDFRMTLSIGTWILP